MNAEALIPPRHAVVTGVSSGIGWAIAQALLAQGWQVTGLSRRPPEAEHPQLHWRSVDLDDSARLAGVAAELGPVDALVHAAGFMRTAPLGALSVDDATAMWRVHVLAAQVLADSLLPQLRDGARIVLVGSRVAQGAAGRSAYAATKSALLGMVRSWAAELAPRGITANVIAPGATDTPFLQQPGRSSSPPRVPPIGRLVQAEEVAGLAAFLLGPLGGAITGQQMVMCGGASL
ncbi:SDR family NAD(P)-dependent oxidoreductase [Curvibacter sp. RS43]|uniref:SDR family NAD(P)-dependent oxidoreductase n=1 Tax=Curvibacter microcysteis TaxID=3026419 RepID=UPI002362E4AA|nr:SDR family oxidoreductase [Curvibacter sp. RS43]MDD0812575.1 SDR family NAD(P)-dependent oxidoreductase [Curvibacter sp. RS43]